MKKCSRCGVEKADDQFFQRSDRPASLTSHCKHCLGEKNRKWSKENPEKVRFYSRDWAAKHPEQMREHRAKNYAIGGREYQRQWCKDNPEKRKAIEHRHYWKDPDASRKYQREFKQRSRQKTYAFVQKESAQKRKWRAKNPEKRRRQGQASDAKRMVRKRGGGGRISVEEWTTLMQLCGKRCLCCGVHCSVRPLEVDHVMPVVRLGHSFIWNTQPLCRPCNRRKWTKHIDYRSTSEHLTEDQRVAIFRFFIMQIIQHLR